MITKDYNEVMILVYSAELERLLDMPKKGLYTESDRLLSNQKELI